MKISDLSAQDIVNLHEEYGSLYKASLAINVRYSSLFRRARRFGLNLSSQRLSRIRKASIEDLLSKLEEYGGDFKKTAHFFDVEEKAIRKRVPDPIYKKYCRENIRKHPVDIDFFKTIDANSAYVAGFIAADGCILNESKNSLALSIGLGYKDYGHLKCIADLLGYTSIVTESRNSGYGGPDQKIVRIKVRCTELCEDLGKNYGVFPRKTHSYVIPDKIINSQYICDFIRGYFDGDGSISKTYAGNGNYKFTFIIVGASRDTIFQIKAVIDRILKENVGNIYDLSSSGKYSSEFYSYVISSKRQLLKLRDVLYYDDAVCLSRKRKVFFNDKLTYKEKSCPIEAICLLTGRKMKYSSCREAEREGGFNRRQVSRCISGERESYRGYTFHRI